MSLCLQNLKDYKNEILKAEIGALLFNLGKTHIGIGNWKEYFDNVEQEFSSYKEYYQKNYFEDELKSISKDLRDFIFDKVDVNLDGNTLKWVEFFKGDPSSENLIKNVFFRGCENINSGIDKGSPKEQIQGKLWISNAFGSFIKEVEKDDFDKKRDCFFKAFDDEAKKNNWYKNPDFAQIREFVLKELKRWYSKLLSDNRMPVNDVTLFEQAYMSATMFKAALAGMLLQTAESKKYKSNPQSIKWQILGVQYDKLALADKGLKPAHIIWYRENAKRVDDEVKKIIEIDYALGNEIYRDESGIYFLVPEGVGEDVLSNDLNEIKEKILDKFNEIFNDEVYPYIGLTKASRGTMNLTYLLDNAKENFLKANYSKKSQVRISGNEIGICQVCQSRLVKDKKDEDETLMCDICRKRKKGRIDTWRQNQNGETIWIDEIGQNGNVAIIGFKFELKEWLNGDLLSSLLVRDDNFNYWLNQIQKFIKLFYSNIEILNINISSIIVNFENSLSKVEKRILGKKIGKLRNIEKQRKTIISFLKEIRNNNLTFFNQPVKTKKFENIIIELIDEFIENVKKLINEIENVLSDNDIVKRINKKEILKLNILKDELDQYNIENFLIHLTEDAYVGCKKWEENFNDYIQQIFFATIVGTKWETFIKKSHINSKIDWQSEIIKWDKLNNDDIDFLSKIILQFILRKNPSPARLRRVWETTQEFFGKVKSEIFDGITVYRTKESFKNLVPDFANLDIEEIEYKQYFSIIDPTPISWQVIIPTQKVQEVIEKIQKLYYENFKYVNGKLPLHIGVVVQKVKSPLYVGIKAIRNMRRDIKNWSKIEKIGKNLLEDLNCYEKVIEQSNNAKTFYSLYETDNFEYEFVLLPSGKKGVKLYNQNDEFALLSSDKKGVKLYNEKDEFVIYPNTFDFEFLDTNTRRNDIFYSNGKREASLKENRPYSWQEWQSFIEFKKVFDGKTVLLHRLVSLIYSKMQDWQKNEESFKKLMQSTFKKEGIDLKKLGIKDCRFDEMKKFIDMFEFWHTALKEI